MEDKNKLIGIVAISVIFVLFVIVILIGLFGSNTPAEPTLSEIDKNKLDAINGSVEAAEKLSTFGKPACPAMMEVVEQASEEEVKVACLQGLAKNKWFESGPMLFKILEKDDQEVTLRYQAYLVTTKIISDHFYNARGPLDERKEKVREMRGEWQGKKDRMDAKAAGGDRK